MVVHGSFGGGRGGGATGTGGASDTQPVWSSDLVVHPPPRKGCVAKAEDTVAAACVTSSMAEPKDDCAPSVPASASINSASGFAAAGFAAAGFGASGFGASGFGASGFGASGFAASGFAASASTAIDSAFTCSTDACVAEGCGADGSGAEGACADACIAEGCGVEGSGEKATSGAGTSEGGAPAAVSSVTLVDAGIDASEFASDARPSGPMKALIWILRWSMRRKVMETRSLRTAGTQCCATFAPLPSSTRTEPTGSFIEKGAENSPSSTVAILSPNRMVSSESLWRRS